MSAVGHLARAARRALALRESSPAGPKPAMPSRSPLAEADQRLNLDGFVEASRALSLGTTRRESAPEAEAETPVPGWMEERSAPRGRVPESTAEVPPAARAPKPATPSRSAPRPARREERGETAAAHEEREEVGGRREIPPTPRVESHVVGRAIQERSKGRVGPPVRTGTAPRAEPPTEPPTEPPRAEVREVERRMSKELVERRVVERAAEPKPVVENPLAQALLAAERWAAGQPESGEPDRPAPVATAGRTRPPDPPTRLEIGSIEVEVVAPPKPQPAQPRRRVQQRQPTRVSRHWPVFGWRQR